MTICILGRQPKLALAELESVFGAETVKHIAPQVAEIALPIKTVLARPLGGVMKLGEIIANGAGSDWTMVGKKIVQHLTSQPHEGKVTLGISAYNFAIAPHEVQKTGLIIKQRLKKAGYSLRLIPNTAIALNTAQVLHNKLTHGDQKYELLVIATNDNKYVIARTRAVQDIEAYTFRDRGRPRRDAYVGMLPPKLAQTMINLGIGAAAPDQLRLLDPFCGTGVILQEAALLGCSVYGTDVSEKMIRYSQDNLAWLADTHKRQISAIVEQADATTATWQPPLATVVCETYLGKPLSSEPSSAILENTKHECTTIIKAFLKNLAPQLAPGTRLCLAVPAWHTKKGIQHIPALDDLGNIGYNRIDFIHASREDMVYHREDQIVGRELVVLIRST